MADPTGQGCLENLSLGGFVRYILIRLLFLPTLAWNVLLGRVLRIRRWWDVVDDRLLIGALPFWWDAKRLAREGVTGVINMCVEYKGPQQSYARLGIDQLWLPTTDFTPPALADVERGVAFISAHIDNGGKVYVHCKAGRGRSATVVVCWLIQEKGVSPEEAAASLTRCRPHVNKQLQNRDVVRAFYRKHVDASSQ